MVKKLKNHIAKVANDACEYARYYIKEGSSNIANNDYNIDKRSSLYKAIDDIRALNNEYNPFAVDIHKNVQDFYTSIQNSQKFSLGNCAELAELALYYIAHEAPDVDAELYSIIGHDFIVIGRDPNSNPAKHYTWGEAAYICDPWANECYPAAHLYKLQSSFTWIHETGWINVKENFNPRHHNDPKPTLNTYHIRQTDSAEYIGKVLNRFKVKAQLILRAVKRLHKELSDIANKLQLKCDEAESEKIEAITHIIEQLHAATTEITNNIDNINDNCPKNNYVIVRQDLEKKLRKNFQIYQQATAVSDADIKTLRSNARPYSCLDKIKLFFVPAPRPTDYVETIDHALKDSDQEVKNLLIGR